MKSIENYKVQLLVSHDMNRELDPKIAIQRSIMMEQEKIRKRRIEITKKIMDGYDLNYTEMEKLINTVKDLKGYEDFLEMYFRLV